MLTLGTIFQLLAATGIGGPVLNAVTSLAKKGAAKAANVTIKGPWAVAVKTLLAGAGAYVATTQGVNPLEHIDPQLAATIGLTGVASIGANGAYQWYKDRAK